MPLGVRVAMAALVGVVAASILAQIPGIGAPAALVAIVGSVAWGMGWLPVPFRRIAGGVGLVRVALSGLARKKKPTV